MRIYVLEDDWLDEEDLTKTIVRRVPQAVVVTDQSEHQFRERLKRWVEGSEPVPDLCVLDVRVRWTFPAPDAPKSPPGWDEDEGYRRAGIRAARLIKAEPRLQHTFVVLISALDVHSTQRHAGDLTLHDLPLHSPSREGVYFFEKSPELRPFEQFLTLCRPAPA